MTLSITDILHSNALRYVECRYAECRILFIVMLRVVMLNAIVITRRERRIGKQWARWCYVDCHNVTCHYVDCHNVACHYVDCL